jgi:hypothetical protein
VPTVTEGTGLRAQAPLFFERFAGGAPRAGCWEPGPRSGADAFDLIDDALALLADRRGVWLGDDPASRNLVAS